MLGPEGATAACRSQALIHLIASHQSWRLLFGKAAGRLASRARFTRPALNRERALRARQCTGVWDRARSLGISGSASVFFLRPRLRLAIHPGKTGWLARRWCLQSRPIPHWSAKHTTGSDSSRFGAWPEKCLKPKSARPSCGLSRLPALVSRYAARLRSCLCGV